MANYGNTPLDAAQLEELLKRFSSMWEDMDFSPQLETLGIGRFQFSRRKEAKEELNAMYVGLWKMALNSSFPDHAQFIMQKFLINLCAVKNQNKKRRMEKFVTLCREYADILQTKGETNFIQIALLLCRHVGCDDQKDLRRMSLQIALDMRNMYHNIFKRLI